jgi:hypothetical protein
MAGKAQGIHAGGKGCLNEFLQGTSAVAVMVVGMQILLVQHGKILLF